MIYVLVTAPLSIRIRGPFGAPAQHVDIYKPVFLICGSIGATYFSSICKQVHAIVVLFGGTVQENAVSGDLASTNETADIEERIEAAISKIYGLSFCSKYGRDNDNSVGAAIKGLNSSCGNKLFTRPPTACNHLPDQSQCLTLDL